MFNTNKTLEQKVKASMATSLHRVLYYYATVTTALYVAELMPSGFTAAFKAVLKEQNSTGHQVAYIIMTGLIHPQRRRKKNDSRSSEDPPELPSEPWTRLREL